jgi:hypothetical protein
LRVIGGVRVKIRRLFECLWKAIKGVSDLWSSVALSVDDGGTVFLVVFGGNPR